MLLLTRPLQDSKNVQKTLESFGVSSSIAPLLKVVARNLTSQAVEQAMAAPALLFTSKNALRALLLYPELHEKPVYCVGKSTARSASSHGFKDIALVAPTVNALLKSVPQDKAQDKAQDKGNLFYYFRGKEITQPIPSALLAGEAIVYEAEGCSVLPKITENQFQQGIITAVGLWSARTADIFAHLMMQHHLINCFSSLSLFCLSETVANAHPLLQTARYRHIATMPNTKSLVQKIITGHL